MRRHEGFGWAGRVKGAAAGGRVKCVTARLAGRESAHGGGGVAVSAVHARHAAGCEPAHSDGAAAGVRRVASRESACGDGATAAAGARVRRIAIVTGATSGVGREFVRQLDAGRGGTLDELWLVARSQERLAEVAASCSHAARVFPLDLVRDESVDVLEAALAQAASMGDVQVMWLVNSAGFGRFGRVWQVGRTESADMVRLNCVALTQLCSVALGYMAGGSRIVNLASVAGIMVQPELAVYSATKSFVFELTRLLDYELRGTGIHATALCPKFMDTRFLDHAGEPQAVRRMTSIGFEDVRRVVSRGIAAALKGRAYCIPAADMRVCYRLTRLLPCGAVLRLQDALFTLRRGASAAAQAPEKAREKGRNA